MDDWNYIGMSDKTIDDGGECASHRQSVAGVSTNGGSDASWDYHYASVVSLNYHIQTEQNKINICFWLFHSLIS